ncbi:urease accessory protein UreH domain-containing protein [Novisyntrophococcus fermenticellae]|uniref:urease accessory protein UreH domain-containing protein n=1 Tax=Novisyntrophococcus fermenticellae TaxID=2068655 RepID=UPI001E4611C0|nr:sulfite exporter TauE/SafE family protein [Novisyntrophococcus fermenticellae]
MASDIRHISLRIGGMTCISCQQRIENALQKTKGIRKVKVSYSTGTADVDFDIQQISESKIKNVIEETGYSVLKEHTDRAQNKNRAVGFLIIIAALYVLLEQSGILNLLVPGQLAETNMGYGMLFVIGLITSVHCVAMCGGINLSQCITQNQSNEGESRFAALRPTFLYNLGRVVSYTIVGFIVGGLGSVITFSTTAQGALKLTAGIFMMIMGMNMLGIFPGLRRLTPRMPRIFSRRINAEKAKSNSPLIVGLLNGLMPCGPLQSMQIYALSTGSPFAGALSMFLFSLGTVPLMFGIGALSSMLSKKFTHKVMTAGAVLVTVLGLSMLSQGFTLSGFSIPSISANASKTSESTGDAAEIADGEQIVNSTLQPGSYPEITVHAGIPVKWVIDAPKGSVNGCNNAIYIPEYDIEYKFKTGENIIEFMPDKTGQYNYSCWMGMIRSIITVVDPGTEIPEASDNGGDTSDSGPQPANVQIPSDNMAIAEMVTKEDKTSIQQVKITLTDEAFSPAIVVVQTGIPVEWVIDNQSEKDENTTMIVPVYNLKGVLQKGENSLGLNPTEDFDFSNGDNTAYGYVKVVDDINNFDEEAVKKEVSEFETLIYPPSWFQTASCCQ